jgi:hypothetical protein
MCGDHSAFKGVLYISPTVARGVGSARRAREIRSEFAKSVKFALYRSIFIEHSDSGIDRNAWPDAASITVDGRVF